MVRKIEAVKMMLLIGCKIVGKNMAYSSSLKDIGQWNSMKRKGGRELHYFYLFINTQIHTHIDCCPVSALNEIFNPITGIVFL